MKVSPRLVCDNCLRSVEWDAERSSHPPLLCPSCGGTIDGALSGLDTPVGDAGRTMPGETELRSDELNRWTETWSKGTLGTVGRFLLRELRGDGGFGQVYQAYDPRLDRDVALKVLKQANPGERIMQRFFREARAAARLEHPNIVAVHDAGCDGGRCWIAYQFVQGRTLVRFRDQNRADFPAAARIIRDLADALEHAHQRGVFHRDLKPANVLIDADGRPRLTDFGLAKRADLESDLTREGAVIGTPAYMPPEQAAGQSHLADARSDVYSLGVMFYELLCNRRPADLPSGAPAWRVAPDAPPPPSPRSIDPSIPRPLERICMTALASDPAARHPNARALADDLDHWLDRPKAPVSGSAHSLMGIVIGLACALLLMVVLQAVHGRRRAATPPATVKEVAPVPPPASPIAASPFVGNRDSKKFHRVGCQATSGLLDRNRIGFPTAEAAVDRGFHPCDKCHPDLELRD